MKKLIITFSIISFLLTSCKNDDDTVQTIETTDTTATTGTGTLKLMFQNFAGEDELKLNTNYITANEDTISIAVLKYFLSNFSIETTEGTELVETDSYHLIKTETDGEMTTWEWEVPTNTYTSLHFHFGVDSTANASTANAKGDLQPSGEDGMAWNWKTGYKFLKMEGSYSTDTTKNGNMVFHLGSASNYQMIMLGEGEMHSEGMKTASNSLFTIEANKTTTLHIAADILEVFNSPNQIDMDEVIVSHSGTASPVSENFKEDVFMLHHSTIE